jgi:hypothetical protein
MLCDLSNKEASLGAGTKHVESRDSSVGIATRLRAGPSRF